MRDEKSKLKVFKLDGATYTDYTEEAWDFDRDEFALALTTAQYLILGRTKKFNAVWFEMHTANTNAATITAEYWNGTAWTALTLYLEETKGLTRSGFVKWESPEDWEASTLNSVEKFYVRLVTSANFSAGTKIHGVNLVFSSDQDLKARRFDIADYLPENHAGTSPSTFILSHVAAREEILQRFATDEKVKIDSDGRLRNLDQWDLFDINQIRNASIYYALYLIFQALSDTKEDKYDSLSAGYAADYEKALQVAILSYDADDDGEDGPDEDFENNSFTLTR